MSAALGSASASAPTGMGGAGGGGGATGAAGGAGGGSGGGGGASPGGGGGGTDGGAVVGAVNIDRLLSSEFIPTYCGMVGHENSFYVLQLSYTSVSNSAVFQLSMP